MPRFFIGPYNEESGLQRNVKPWLISDVAFSELSNAYVFRGRVRKRFGSDWLLGNQLLSRLRVQIGVTNGAGAFVGNIRVILADAGMPTAIGQSFSIADTIFTVFNPAAGPQQMHRSDASVAVATYDLGTSAVNITGATPATAVFFYPGFPVMGLLTYEVEDVNNEITIAFDTRYAYQFTAGWDRIAGEAVAGAAVWTGTNPQFFWNANWTGANAFDKLFFVTNFNENEPNFMRYFDGALWNNFRPAVSATDFLNSARIIVPFKNRLVALNTWEGVGSPGNHYPFRARWSQIGSPIAVDAWRQDIPGKGSGLDAPTTEAIVTAEFVKDRLIVYFERSTWELVYTGNQIYPFAWQQINTELGVESTFSIVPFDKVAIGVGNVGIHACNGANVERIDTKIPDEVFEIHNPDNGVERVYGIRDYFTEIVYWTFPSIEQNADFPFPSRVLIYNYRNNTWAFNDDSITVFGYFQPQTGILWSSTIVTWDDMISWTGSQTQPRFRQVIAGNQEGYTFICDADVPTNAPVIQITDLIYVNVAPDSNLVTITAIDHNFADGDFIWIDEIVGFPGSNLNLLNNSIQQIDIVLNKDMFSFSFDEAILAGNYAGGGVIARVSKINIKTKEYNFFAQEGKNAAVSKVEFLVDQTAAGELTVDFFTSSGFFPLLQDGAQNGSILGTSILETFPYTTFEAACVRIWHPVYIDAVGEVIQFQLTMNDDQMKDLDIRLAPFELHAMIITADPAGRLEQF